MSFTTDGRELVFSAKQHCDELSKKGTNPTVDQMCWSIATLDFAQALSTPIKPELRYQCQVESISKPKALTNHQYAFLQYEGGRYQLVQYDDLSKELTPLYSSEENYIYHFDYDPSNKRFVIISRNKRFDNQIELLDKDGRLISREKIQLSEEMSQYQNFVANFGLHGEYLLAISNNRLYKIGLNGQLRLIKTPEANLVSVAEHPRDNSVLAVKGKKDIDIARITLGEKDSAPLELELNAQKLPFASLARTTAQERNAMYQPNGEQIAFISDRSGHDQIWIWRQFQNQGQALQLTFETSQNSIHSYSWSPDGNHLAWVSDDKLAVTDLSGNTELFSTNKPLFSVLSWYKENQLLVLLNDPIPGGLYRLNFAKNELIPFGVNQVEAAWVHKNQLIYSNLNGDVFTRPLDKGNSETKRLPHLNGKALFIYEQLLYSVDRSNLILNQYNMEGQFIKAILPLKATAWKVTGLKNNELLLSQFIAINNDIVVLE
ncbi:MAG: hypothetical protein OQK04_18540, partial [Kangiellaceae bacterium]|nr:hypothetical protein [Kangiellaceae bacterium]